MTFHLRSPPPPPFLPSFPTLPLFKKNHPVPVSVQTHFASSKSPRNLFLPPISHDRNRSIGHIQSASLRIVVVVIVVVVAGGWPGWQHGSHNNMAVAHTGVPWPRLVSLEQWLTALKVPHSPLNRLPFRDLSLQPRSRSNASRSAQWIRVSINASRNRSIRYEFFLLHW